MTERIPVAVLAATGAVGQRFVSLLADHPWFEVAVVTGSDRSAGLPYAEAVSWVVPGEIPAGAARLVVQPTGDAGALDGVRLAFSALPGDIARAVETDLAARGLAVCSNASALRMEPDVPLLIPEVNPDHLALIPAQREQRGWTGLAVTSPNCSTTGIVLPLKALHDAFGLARVHAVTMQAISGAGYPGVPSFDVLDNVIPFINGEEEKVEQEPRKLLGAVDGGVVRLADFTVSAQTHRVPVMDGHLAAISVELAAPAALADVQAALAEFKPPAEVRGLPSAPPRPLIVRGEPDRPQPRRDRDAANGMAVTVGRVQPCPVLGFKLVALVHNTVRGAAGGAILNAELLAAQGYLGDALPVKEGAYPGQRGEGRG